MQIWNQFFTKRITVLLLYMYQVFILQQDHLYLFLHHFFGLMGLFYEWPYITGGQRISVRYIRSRKNSKWLIKHLPIDSSLIWRVRKKKLCANNWVINVFYSSFDFWEGFLLQISKLRTAAKLLQAKYGANNSEAVWFISQNDIIVATMPASIATSHKKPKPVCSKPKKIGVHIQFIANWAPYRDRGYDAGPSNPPPSRHTK